MRRRRFKFLRNARGQAIVSNLVAAAIVATTAAGTASLVQYLNTQRVKSQVLNRVVVLQSEVTAALLRKDQYELGHGAERDQMIENIRLGKSANDFPLLNAKGQVIAVVNKHFGYDRDGGTSCKESACAAFVDLDIRCGDANTVGCASAYRVTPAPLSNAVAPPPLGAPLHTSSQVSKDGPAASVSCGGVEGFACADYTVPISYDFFTQAAQVGCDETDDVMMSGFNRTTGKPQCVKKAATPCADGTIAHNVKSALDTKAGAMRLEMDCHPLAHVACPPDYVLERLGVQQLDLGKDFRGDYKNYGQPAGKCRYRWRNNIPWTDQTPLARVDTSGGSATATTMVCNDKVYRAKFKDGSTYGGCGSAITSSSPGDCAYSCNCETDENGGSSCDTCHYYPSSQVSVTQHAIAGAVVSCTVTVTHQCGSSMTAHAVAEGICQVNEPYFSHIEVDPKWK